MMSERRDTSNKSQNVPRDLLVQAVFHPGFAEDLTSWETSLSFDGTLVQTVKWYGPVHARRVPERLSSHVSDHQLDDILKALQNVDLPGIEALNAHFCIDDAELIHLLAPEYRLNATSSPYSMELLGKREEIPIAAQAGLSTFRQAWDAIESVSPYTTTIHWK